MILVKQKYSEDVYSIVYLDYALNTVTLCSILTNRKHQISNFILFRDYKLYTLIDE